MINNRPPLFEISEQRMWVDQAPYDWEREVQERNTERLADQGFNQFMADHRTGAAQAGKATVPEQRRPQDKLPDSQVDWNRIDWKPLESEQIAELHNSAARAKAYVRAATAKHKE